MPDLYHVVLKDHENSGYVWDEFYCPSCLDDQITKFQQLEILRQTRASPQYLSRLYPPLVNEPECRECGARFNPWKQSTEKENPMNREILERPFAPEQIKQREGHSGMKLDYIEGHAVIQRLNDAFDGEWSFTIVRHEILTETDEVLVLGELKAGGIVKSQFGSSRITRARETGDIISLADDFKAAATDALKKAATLLGIGLHLYRNDRTQGAHRQTGSYRNGGNGNNGGNNTNGNTNGGNGNNRPSGGHRNGGNNGNGSDVYCGSGNGNNGNGRLTNNQYKYMLRLNEEQGRSKTDLDQQCLQLFGAAAEYLSKNDASAVIQQLLAN